MMSSEPSQPLHLTSLDRVYETVAPFIFGPLWLAAGAITLTRNERLERAGMMPAAGGPLLWFHGASAGEMSAAVRLAALLREAGHHFTAAYTATNRAGVDFAGRTAKSPAISALVPWDVKPWIVRALDRWRPVALFLMETELWPQLILEATRRGVPVFSVSARIYPKDFGRYQAIRRFIGPVIGRITTIFAQNEIERARFIALGMPAERCIVSGNLKYLGVKSVERRIELGIRPADWVVVFGSIHADEIEFVLRAIERFRSEGIRVVIAPRHPVSAPPIVRRCLKAGWNVALRTATHDRNEWNLLVLDTIGELAGAYAQARVAVVGGGFAKHGGHNPFEPLMAGVPVAIGTHFDHFEDEARQLGTATPPARVGDDMGELGNLLTRWMRDDAERARVLAAQSKLIPDARVIGRSYVEGLSPWLRGLST